MFNQPSTMLSDGNSVSIHYDSNTEKYLLTRLSDRSPELLEKSEFHRRIVARRIVPMRSPKLDPDRSEHLDMDLSAFCDDDVREGLRRADYARAILEAGEPTPQCTAWKVHAETVAIQKGDKLIDLEGKPIEDGKDVPGVKRKQEPNWKTLAGWVRQYKEAGMDFRVLIPRNYRKGRRVRIRGEEEEKVIREFDALYLTMERPVPALLYKNMQVRYHTEKKHNPLAKSWNLMSRSAFYDRLARLDKFEVTRRRYGLQVAKTMFMHGGNGPVAEHPLDVVELDATESDCEVWNDEMTAVIGRPWVYVAIDRCTRMVVGIYIGFEPPSAYSLLQCVKNGVLPKNLRESYPDIPYDWPVMGAWGTAVTDNSKEALSNSLKSVLGILGTDHDLAPILTPQFKGIVERFLKTFNEDGTARIPGKTFGNPVKRGEYISSEAAVLTISQFRYFIHYWLIVDYNYAWHDGIAAVPALLWEERIKGYQPRLPEALGEIDGHFGQLHTATLSKTGLTFKYLEYKSAYLSDLHYKYGNIELSFKVDPIDLSFIYVVDPNNKRLCAVPCDDLTYTNGLTLHQHEQVLKLRRKRKVNWENSEIRLEMRAELIAWTENLLKEAKATKKRAHARTANQGVVQPQSRQSGEEALARLLAKARSKPAGENPFAKHSSVRASGASTSIEPTDEIDISAFKIHKGEHRV